MLSAIASIAAAASSGDETCESTATASSAVSISGEVVVVAGGIATVETFSGGPETTVVAKGFIGGKVVVVGDTVEPVVLVGRNDDVGKGSEELGVDDDDEMTVVVVLGSVDVVKGGSVEVDVVVVSSGCVVVVLDDVVEDCVVVGESLDVVVCHTWTVLLVVSCITVVDAGTVSSIVVLVSVDEVVGSTVVVVSGSVDVVVLDVLVAADVVGWMGDTEVPRSYCTPDHQASGLPQHTPALSRYQPAWTWYWMLDCNPYQSSFWARS